MIEIVPVALGAASGLLVGGTTARRPMWLWLSVSLLLGIAATTLTGEWKTTWAFLIIDIPLVALSSAAAFMAVRTMERRRRPSDTAA